MLIQAEKITFGYTDKPLFNKASFSVNEGDRIGLVGDNGAGKSTLFKCLLGIEKTYEGQIVISRNVDKIAYIPQSLPTDLKEKTFYDYLLEAIPVDERDYSGWKVDVAMEDIGVPQEIKFLPLAHLSGGWQRMALIARAILDEPSLMLMDEPTNYLDLEKIFKLENLLLNIIKIPYIVISHDRKFLDKCTNKTMHLRDGQIICHKVPYSHARTCLLEEDLAAAKARENEEAEIERIRAAAKRIHIWSAGRNPDMDKRAKAMYTRANQLEAKKTEVYVATKREIDFNPDDIRPKVLLRINNYQVVAPDGRALFKIPEMNVKKGDRVAILATNGVGKTQMLEALMRAYKEPVVDSKNNIEMRFNPQVNIGYFDQHMAHLPLNKTITDYIQSLGKTTPEATKLLVNAGFPYKNHTQKISELSQGEKARLAFLALKVGKFNFFIMDEPTNHIDIDGQEKFEDAVISEGHTCIFVSHDRYMMEQVANKYYQVKKGTLVPVDSVEPFYKEVMAKQDIMFYENTKSQSR